jgi:DNA polymerase alpha subunit B
MGDPDTALTSRFGPLEPDVLSELRSMMHLHDLSAEDVFWKWEAFSIKMDIDVGQVTLSAVRNLKANLREELEKRASKGREIKTERKIGGTPRGGGVGDVYGVLDGLVPGTPVGGGKRVVKGAKTPGSKLKEVLGSSPGVGTPGKGEEQIKYAMPLLSPSL